MNLTWFDALLFVPLAAVVVFETRQEFGRGLMDTLAAGSALFFASSWSSPLADYLPMGRDGYASAALAFVLLFAVLLVGGIFLSRIVHQQFRMSLDQFDPVLGVVTGLAVAFIVGHALSSTLLEYHGGMSPTWLSESWLVDEFVNWRTLRAAADTVQALVVSH